MPIAPTPSPDRLEAMAARLLFGGAAKALRDGRDAAERDRLLDNAYISLQAYRPDPDDILRFAGLQRTTHGAVDAALGRTAPGISRPEALEALFGRMRAVAVGEGSRDDVEHVARFFECAREGLDA